jgi:hypothetical protein
VADLTARDLIRAVAVVGFWVALPLVWVRATVGSRASSSTALDLPAARWLLLSIAAGLLISAVLTAVSGLEGPASHVLGGCALIGLGVSGLLLIGLEVAGVLLPSFVLPTTVRRLTVQAGAGPGLWLAAGSAAVLFASAVVPDIDLRVRSLISFLDRRSAAGLFLAATGLFVLGRARYLPWVTASAGGRSGEIEGWAVPFLGPLTLLSVWALGAALLCWFVRPAVTPLLVAAAAGWFSSFLSAIAIISGDTIARIRVDDFLPASVRHLSPAAHVAPGPRLAFVASVTTVAAVAYLLHRVDDGRDQIDLEQP